ncbi:MAG TPA: FtsX-like permease family protein [Spirochaetia bacterium]|nr:FtsX-like permease family protein [Spirochaetia bacterium]
MNVWTMALRNLGRNRRRTALALLSVLIAMTAVVFADGLVSGILDSMARNFTKNQTGHVNVATTDYRHKERFMPASAALPDSDAVADAIRSTPGLAGQIVMTAPRALFGVVLSSDSGTKAARGIGGDPLAEKSLLMLDRSLLPGGSYLAPTGTVIVGKKLADDLGLRVGDTLKVIAEKADYGMGFKKFRISGLFRTGVEGFDGATIMVSLDDARDLLGLGRGASEVLVMLKNYKTADRAAAAISAHLATSGLGGLSVQSWKALGDVAALITFAGAAYFWMELIIAFLGAFIIANILMMVVLERRREIGILMSMGMERPRILGLFLAEGLLLGAIGSAIGSLLGTAINAWASVRGLDFSRNIAGTGIPMDSIVYPQVNLVHVAWLFAMGIAVAAIISFLPSRSAARMNPIEAIRSV